jgi:hypothetical protein
LISLSPIRAIRYWNEENYEDSNSQSVPKPKKSVEVSFTLEEKEGEKPWRLTRKIQQC